MTDPVTQPESSLSDAQSTAPDSLDTEKINTEQQLLNYKAIQKNGRSLAEWITFAIASIILVTLVVLIIYDWQVNQLRPPEFQVTVDTPTRTVDNQYYVPFDIQNTGGQIARTVQVTATLQIDGAEDETGDQQIDYLSGNEHKYGSFVFSKNPDEGDLMIRVASYRLP
jgi:uncharacterized protein (TIGR02588 family)